MITDSHPLQILFKELQKLTEDDVSAFCGKSYFQTSQLRFQSGLFPKNLVIDKAQSDFMATYFTLNVDGHEAEIAILKKKWEISTDAEKLIYRFIPSELSLCLFTSVNNSNLPSRQILCDTFLVLWLLAFENEKLQNWFNTEVKFNSIIELKRPFLNEMAQYELSFKTVKSLLICIPSVHSSEADNTLLLPNAPASIETIQGKYFKASNQSDHKMKASSPESRAIETVIYQCGLIELQALMSSGQIVPLKNNEDIISLLENHRTEKADRRMLDKLCSIDENDSLLMRAFERNKLFLIDKFFESNKDVQLVFGYNHLQQRNSVHCKEFSICTFGGIYQKPKVATKLYAGYGQLNVKLEVPDCINGSVVSNQVAYFSQTQTIVFHNFHQVTKEFAHFISRNDFSTDIHISEKILGKKYDKTIFGHNAVFQFLKNLHFELGTEVSIQHIEESILEEPLTTQVILGQKDFRIRHNFKYKNRSLFFANLCTEWKPILAGLQSGLVGALSRKTIEAQLSNRRSQRQVEHKLISHSGIYITILLATMEWKLKGERLEKSKSLFLEELWQKIYLLLAPKNDVSNAPIPSNELISQKVKSLINEFIDTLLDLLDKDFEIKLILENEILSVKSVFSEQAKVFYFWLQQLTLFTKGEILTKSNTKYLPPDWFELPQSKEGKLTQNIFVGEVDKNDTESKLSQMFSYPIFNFETHFALPLNRWAKLPQSFPEISLSIEGHELESISANQFKINFELSNSNANSPADKGQSDNRIDWFDLNPKYFLNGVEISEIEAKKLTFDGVLEYQGRFYILDSDEFPAQRALEIFWRRLQFNQQKNSKSSFNKEATVPTQKHHVLELLALRRMGIEFKGPPEWEEICNYYDNLSQPRCQLNLGDKLNEMLKPYQLSGVQWLWDLFQLRVGGILADDMGLGKTAQALSFLQYGKSKGSIKRVLIIVPVSLTFNWIAEAQKFTPDLNISVFDPKLPETTKADIIVCTYSLLSLHHQLFENILFDVIIFDEAQYLKNIGTNRFKSSEFIKAKFKVALTGTPIENNLAELYSLFHLVAPGLLGSRQDFQKDFVKPESLPKESLEFLKAKLKPLILRRRKQDLSLELPDKTENQIYVDFSEKQKELYRNTALSWSQKVNEAIHQKGSNQSKIYMLTALLRLRQVCSDPAALPSVNYTEIPPKISILIDMLEEITEEGNSAIVFTQFMSTFTRLKDLLQKHHIQFFEMHGGTPRKDRETMLKNFSSDTSEKGSVLLMTLKTGGVGLNLTKASYVFHLEPWWNPAVENQATDRVHRLGQSKNVTVYRMIMRESVEEKVEILKSRKSQLFNNIFGDDYFSLESANEKLNTENPAHTAITKEDFDVLIQ